MICLLAGNSMSVCCYRAKPVSRGARRDPRHKARRSTVQRDAGQQQTDMICLLAGDGTFPSTRHMATKHFLRKEENYEKSSCIINSTHTYACIRRLR